MLSKSVVTCQKIKSVEKGAFFFVVFFKSVLWVKQMSYHNTLSSECCDLN